MLVLSALKLSAQSTGYLEFVENKGQWDSSVIYKADLSAGAVYIQKKGFLILQQDTADLRRIHSLLHGEIQKTRGAKPASVTRTGKGTGVDPYLLHSHLYRVTFENANEKVEIVPDKPLADHVNYLSGKARKGAAGCRIFQGVIYKNLYEGIDLHYYTEQGFVKYDLIVHPGADPSKIVLKYEGQNNLSLRKNQVYVQTSVGTVKELDPKSYQVNGQGREPVGCKYKLLGGGRITFKLDDYSRDATLVIDPAEVFCSFTGSHSDNWGYTATYDNSGNFYLGGIVIQYSGISGSLFGATVGAFQSTYQGGDGSEGGFPSNGQFAPYDYDIGIMKFNSSGSRRLWATYLGGTGDEQPHSMVCDAQGNLIITGRTSSTAWPPYGTLPTFGPCGGLDIFVAKLSADGSTLMGVKKIGGTGDDGVNNSPKYLNSFGQGTQELRLNYGDDGRSEVILDAAGNIYVAACTRPAANKPADFPTTPGVFQPVFGGGTQDGVLIKLSPDVNTVLFSSYLGGNNADAAFVLALNPINNNIYVAGGTLSTDLQGAVVRPASPGDVDGFVSIVSNNGSNLLKSTYIGMDGTTDMVYGIGFDKNGFPYIMGTTYGIMPVINSPFNQGGNQATGKQFITKLQPDLSAIVYSANFGPGGTPFPNISPTAFLVDRCDNVYVSGWGGGIDPGEFYNNSGTRGLVTTPNALTTTTDGDDFYFFVLQKNAASQLYGSFFGQVNGHLGDHVDGGTSRFDPQGVIYQAICANCGGGATFPTTPGVAFSSNNALSFGGCNEAAVKIAFNFAGVSAGLKLSLQGRGDSVGCTPLLVGMQDTVRNAKSYIWDFGDGSRDTTTDYSLQHSYTAVGVYTVALVAIDSNSCNVADTVYKTVTVKNNPATLAFDISKLLPCTAFNYAFNNESTHTPASPPFTPISFIWNFGDGSPEVRAGLGITDHSYSAPGPYTVQLILADTNYCNYPDTLTQPFYVAQNVLAQFVTPSFGCAPYTAVFQNTSIAGSRYYWDFGDGSPIDSVDVSPSHLYTVIGSYTIHLTAVDSNTCNIISDTSITINVQGKPTAGFTFAPTTPVPNTPTVFTDASLPSPLAKYQWFFGDGGTETKTTPDTVVHQYERTDTFQVCLVVTNQSGCTDTTCQAVAALVNPLLDVPNAFTPGRFGENGIVKVVGFGITHLVFRIYNRWGQMVFQSNDPYIGWDGTYKGVLQPMDVYGYTVEAQFFNGTRATKKGDITLIR